MTGKEIFDRCQLAALKNGLGSQEFHYGNILYQALRLEGEEKVFQLLEQAENTGKRVGLGYSSNGFPTQNDPDMAILV
ncbi:hypothetical protein MUK70_09125 [Dyadobacter chenwenxiniae]|uniref:Uncharacterized protein n=1 Tax=Dyadobacter chenwenxiniae TaxID=2906456 RepID=A0A9X1TMG8_9BACT|nr:hypothetical protein [Dyadobacter chenwenxiniae]MCF0051947.1 hypothetical protein [Dyadobacter chenwenxiniae]MCF0063478.1 hypothetical protein [Dyadobacter chenwenxiniae]UON85143.1 hypothetical protein MUK70_09125 [Dyadobacter chenwenxiniae]